MAARGLNKVMLIGNLGSDPEVRFMPSGGAVANFSLATSESWKDKNSGELQEKTEWHRVVLFNRVTEIAKEYLRKGSKVYIEGRLQTRKWTDKDNIERYTTEIIGNEMQMLDSRGSSPGRSDFDAPPEPFAEESMQGSSRSSGSATKPAKSAPTAADFDDDVPF